MQMNLTTYGIYQERLLTDVCMTALCTFDEHIFLYEWSKISFVRPNLEPFLHTVKKWGPWLFCDVAD